MLLLASAAVVAQESTPRVYRSGYEWIEESAGSLAGAKSLRVKTSSGAIQAQGNQQNGVTYTIRKRVRAASEEAARREFARLRVYAANSAEGSIIRGERENYVRGSIDFDIQLPRQISFVRLETGNGHLLARNITGKVEAITGASTIQLDEIGGDVHARSGGGDIEIGKAGGDVRAETGGGGIHIVSAGGKVFAVSGGGELSVGSAQAMVLQTGAGAIHVDKCTGEVTASTGGGSVDLNEVTRDVNVRSGGGSIKAVRIAGGLRVDTGSGPIVVDLAATRGSFTESRLETAAGDIVVYIPDDLGITIRAAVELANGEGIVSKDFPALQVSHGSQQLGPREIWAEGSLNGGGPLLHVHTTTGTITFKRRETSARR